MKSSKQLHVEVVCRLESISYLCMWDMYPYPSIGYMCQVCLVPGLNNSNQKVEVVLIIYRQFCLPFFLHFFISGGAFGGKETKILVVLPVAVAAHR